jgi:hypothetical protein
VLLALLLPLTATAASIQCKSQGSGGDLAIGIAADSIFNAGSEVKIAAQGMLLTEVISRIDSVNINPANQLTVELTTLNGQGIEDQFSGKATLELHTQPIYGQFLVKEGRILVHKAPRMGMVRFLSQYKLSECKGFL